MNTPSVKVEGREGAPQWGVPATDGTLLKGVPATAGVLFQGVFKKTVNGLLLIGLLTILGGLLQVPTRVWANLLLVGYYLVGLGLAGLLFVAIQFAMNAGWSVSFRRVPEALSKILPFSGLFLLGILLVQPLFVHSHPVATETHPALWFKQLWLSRSFLLSRAVFYLLLWNIFAYCIVRNSRQQDEKGEPELTFRNKAWSSVFIVVFGLTFSLASFDWVMALEPEWFSTMFGVYNFAGLFQSGLAAITISVIMLKRRGLLSKVVTHEHLHALGKLLFGFSSFWMYIWFCQYMLIWYVNNPEETVYFIPRLKGFWEPVFLFDMALNWIIPFLVLLPRPSKRNENVLLTICWVILLGRWVDLYLMIFPSLFGAAWPFEIWEIGMALGGLGLLGHLMMKTLSAASLVPVNDPLLAESINHHQ